MGVRLLTVVQCETVNLVPQGEHRGFESLRSHSKGIEMKIKEECLGCEQEIELLFEEGESGECPHCKKKYTVDYVEGDDELQILWFTGININAL